MAFNPFSGFAKYKRIWMASVLILVMITFVLCSGTRGDMGDILLRVFRFGGTPVASVAGRTYDRQDFDRVIRQRKIANDYMRRFSLNAIEMINDRIRGAGDVKDENAKQAIVQLSQIRELLTLRTKDPKFFETGTKTDDIVDFLVWLAEADRLGVRVPDKLVYTMIGNELFREAQRNMLGEQSLYQLEAKVMQDVRQAHGYEGVSPDFVFDALRNEYRVRIAKLADAEYQFATLGLQQFNPFKRIRTEPTLPAVSVRTPISPAQIWDFYQQNRKEFDVALLPLPVAEFAGEVSEPDPQKLQTFFEKHKKTPYDPSSDQPGFRKPHKVKIQYVTADKNSPFYKNMAQTFDLLTEYPIGSFVPQYPLATAITYLAQPMLFDTAIEGNYAIRLARERMAQIRYQAGEILDFHPRTETAMFLAARDPKAVASLVAAAGRPQGTLTAVSFPLAVVQSNPADRRIIQEATQSAVRELAPLYATVAASGSIRPGLVAAAQLRFLDRQPRFLPFAAVRDIFLREHRERLAGKFVSANMAFLKKKLEDEIVAGKAPQVERLLDRYGPLKPGETRDPAYRDLGLEIAVTDKFHDRFSIKNASELKPLLEAFDRYYAMVNITEGRDAQPETQLKEDDFWKLFFDGSETFSVARGRYEAKPWPPVIKLGTPAQINKMISEPSTLEVDPNVLRDMQRQANQRESGKEVAFNLFATSDRPFLFWKTDEKPAEVPESLADVKDRVVQEWKMQQARENKVLPYARKLAEGLLKGNAPYAQVLEADPKFGKDLLAVRRLAPLAVERHFNFPRYGEYKLPRGLVPYPREDMVQQLLTLNDLKKPIKQDIPELDRLNEELFRDAEAKKLTTDRFVQVLTNKPRDMYYLAVVSLPSKQANTIEFFSFVLTGAARMPPDRLFDIAAERLGQEHYRELVRQLRKLHNVDVYEAAKTFDNESGS